MDVSANGLVLHFLLTVFTDILSELQQRTFRLAVITAFDHVANFRITIAGLSLTGAAVLGVHIFRSLVLAVVSFAPASEHRGVGFKRLGMAALKSQSQEHRSSDEYKLYCRPHGLPEYCPETMANAGWQQQVVEVGIRK
eukprot:CAMPEP_0197639268 /NCGR_PEP_ID=MMETSP1338-20131121/13938_1 /TAXON_ID=43686 ORGANISM="Pelagodinium beii, Strain RCC1491" /NCGR_SAMPLE_ID=MMETSP1338 /ASSEMBLY_ACC=CAM_ASM_000754 /LENGTH=138 /DNA_ID=CAMNT_0043211971 /DNA_START=207 /DNA_END=623 /DNA_ORIENTATION=+